MLFLFLALYVALGVGCVVMGIVRTSRMALVCGVVTLVLAAASLLVGALYAAGSTHWTLSVLQVLLSPMPESVLEPQSVSDATQGLGIPVIALSAAELVVAIALWAVPVIGLVAAGRAPRRARVS
jgi:hypothetical protein